MDTEEKVSKTTPVLHQCLACFRLPITGFAFCILLCAAFLLSQVHDHSDKNTLYVYYQEHLLSFETPYYKDFYDKRLNIDQVGSSKQLQRIQEAIQSSDVSRLTRFILDDKNFRSYLEDKANIYFEPHVYSSWLNHNAFIRQNLATLNVEQFGLSPTFHLTPSLLKLFSYPFIDEESLHFALNLVTLLIICSLLEAYFKKAHFSYLLTVFSVLFGLSYLSVASDYAPTLFSASGLVYSLAMLLIAILLRDIKQSRQSYLLFILAFLSVFLFLKIYVDYYFSTFHTSFGYSLLLFLPLTALMGWFYPSISFINHPKEKIRSGAKSEASTTFLSDPERHLYAQAMSAISRFNFSYARKVMSSLIASHPNTYQLLETSYHLEKLHPQDGYFWSLADARISHCLETRNYQNMLSTFSDIQKAAPSRELACSRINPDSYLKMLVIFNEFGNIEKAEHAFMFLELSGNAAIVREACNLLIESFKRRKNDQKKQHYQALLEHYLDN